MELHSAWISKLFTQANSHELSSQPNFYHCPMLLWSGNTFIHKSKNNQNQSLCWHVRCQQSPHSSLIWQYKMHACANVYGRPLFQGTKQQLNGEKWNVGYLSVFGCGALVSSVWKNIGMTMTFGPFTVCHCHANVLPNIGHYSHCHLKKIHCQNSCRAY